MEQIGDTSTTQLLTNTTTDTLNQSATEQFFTGNGAKINRVNDRLFVGDATTNDGAAPNLTQDWLTQYQISKGRSNGALQFAQQAVLTNTNNNASFAFVAGARSSTLTGIGNATPITGIGLNDNINYNTNTYAYYGEAYNALGSLGAAYGMELDTVNYRAGALITPYSQSNYEVVGLQLAAGAGLSSTGQFPSSAAINIWNNNSTFDRGIVFGSSAISGATGTSGTGIAIALGQGHMLQWYGSNTAPSSFITCTVPEANAANATALQFTTYGFQVQMRSGQVLASFPYNTTAANYLEFIAGKAGIPVQIQAQGSDQNINLFLVPKGMGFVQFGTYTAGSISQTGYITILDAGGIPRRLLVG